MTEHAIILGIALIGGLYMAWNIGANDVANAMGTSVGSGAITFKQAVVLAGIFEFLGAMLVGVHVTDTVRKGIVPPECMADADIYIAGMLSALIAAAVWLNVATYFGLPVSTTHSIVGAIAGFGLLYGGFACLNWGKLFSIVMSWVVSPVSGALIGFFVFRYINNKVFKSEKPALRAQEVAPRLIFPVIVVLVLAIFYKGLKNLHLDLPFLHALGMAVVLGLAASLICSRWLKKAWRDCSDEEYSEQIKRVEGIFRYLQIGTACYVAFAHGANDVANAVGPLAGVYTAIKMQTVQAQVTVPPWILAIGAVGIVVGLGTWGYRVIATVGEKITEMTPTRGFSAEFACATTVLVCSRLGLPVSTTHTLVGSVIGVSLARGLATLDRKVVLNIIYSWVITIPAAAALTILLYQVISRL
jgi:PiT family inorganic phosphate transporter